MWILLPTCDPFLEWVAATWESLSDPIPPSPTVIISLTKILLCDMNIWTNEAHTIHSRVKSIIQFMLTPVRNKSEHKKQAEHGHLDVTQWMSFPKTGIDKREKHWHEGDISGKKNFFHCFFPLVFYNNEDGITKCTTIVLLFVGLICMEFTTILYFLMLALNRIIVSRLYKLQYLAVSSRRQRSTLRMSVRPSQFNREEETESSGGRCWIPECSCCSIVFPAGSLSFVF